VRTIFIFSCPSSIFHQSLASGEIKIDGKCSSCLWLEGVNLWAKHLDELEVKSFLLDADSLLIREGFFIFPGQGMLSGQLSVAGAVPAYEAKFLSLCFISTEASSFLTTCLRADSCTSSQ